MTHVDSCIRVGKCAKISKISKGLISKQFVNEARQSKEFYCKLQELKRLTVNKYWFSICSRIFKKWRDLQHVTHMYNTRTRSRLELNRDFLNVDARQVQNLHLMIFSDQDDFLFPSCHWDHHCQSTGIRAINSVYFRTLMKRAWRWHGSLNCLKLHSIVISFLLHKIRGENRCWM